MAPVNWQNDPEVVEARIRQAEDLGYRQGTQEVCSNPNCKRYWHGLPIEGSSQMYSQGGYGPCPGSYLFDNQKKV